jgi:hypothetical protein
VSLVKAVCDALINVRLQAPKSEVFELLFELPDPQPVGEWREDLEGFLTDGASYLFHGVPGGAQSTNLMCQGHKHNPWVLRDRQKHLPETVRLQSLGCGFAQVFKAGDTTGPLRQAGNLDADLFLNRRRIERTLLDQGKQQSDCTGFGIHSEVTEEFSGFHAAFHRRVLGGSILGKLTSDQQPGPCQAAQSGTADRRLDHSEAIF